MLFFLLHLSIKDNNFPFMEILLADVRTQGTYQLLDSGFIGLIFSCFSEDANKVRIVACFALENYLWHFC